MRWLLPCLLWALVLPCFADAPKPADTLNAPGKQKAVSVQGTLKQSSGQLPAIETGDHTLIYLKGDSGTERVLHDKRLDGFELTAKGHFIDSTHFQVDPIHTKALFVHKNGHLKIITYWCSTCSIRRYTPGPCPCCQQEMVLDLKDPNFQERE